MRTSAEGRRAIQRREGRVVDASGRHVPYFDGQGHLTVGYGHLVNPGESFDRGLSEAEADELFSHDLRRFETAVGDSVTVPLTQSQFDALVSWAFNVGTGAVSQSTLVKRLNAGDYGSVPGELARWNVAGGVPNAGLAQRRSDEGAQFSSDGPRSVSGNVSLLAPLLVASALGVMVFRIMNSGGQQDVALG